MKKLPSLTIFFPFFNDEKTVFRALSQAQRIGQRVAQKIELIAIHGGNSTDNTWPEILKAKRRLKRLRIINKKDNQEGYAVIKRGFAAARCAWVFYTDGDLQYYLEDLPKLVQKQLQTGCDVVNGYKARRADVWTRVWFGKFYQLISNLMFKLPIKDVDCDFRLIRRNLLSKISLESSGGSILPELIKKLEKQGAIFKEVPVRHRLRCYGSSCYSVWSLAKEKLIGDFKLWIRLKK